MQDFKDRILIAAVAVGLLALNGCCHSCGCGRAPAAVPPPYPPAPTRFVPTAPPGTTLPPQNIPPGSPPQIPPPAPPPGQFVPQAPPPPAPIAPDVRGYGPITAAPADPQWRAPEQPEVRLSGPQSASPEPAREQVRLSPPETDSQPPALPPQTREPPRAALPTPPVRAGVAEDRTPTPPLPVGIPQFATAKDRVTSGLRPQLDGLDWLQANGYRTVLHIRAPGEDDTADRRQVEKRGLKYLSIELSPQTLTRTGADEFNRIVGDTTGHPLFVYDRDGLLAGGLWYLHFRILDGLSDEAARAKAANLGLKEDPNGASRTMWLAIQKLLSEQGR